MLRWLASRASRRGEHWLASLLAEHRGQPAHGVLREFGLGPAEKFSVPQPGNLPSESEEFLSGQEIVQPAPKVYLLEDAWLLGEDALPFDCEGRLFLPGTSRLKKAFVARSKQNHAACRALEDRSYVQKLQPRQTSQLACALTVPTRRCIYYHWIVDCLSMLQGVLEIERSTGEKSDLIVRGDSVRYVGESLEDLGLIPERNLQRTEPNMICHVKNLIIVDPQKTGPVRSPASLRWLRNFVRERLGVENLDGDRRLLIRRDSEAGRYFRNEQELEELLAAHEFEALRPETLRFKDQVRLFAQVDALFAGHGSALTNMLWSRQMNVYEVFGTLLSSCYYRIALSLGHCWRGIFACEQSGNPNAPVEAPLEEVARLFRR